jgi:hypothetical protein
MGSGIQSLQIDPGEKTMFRCRRVIRWIFGVFVLAAAAAPLQVARADTGPKPTMKFDIVYEISPAPSIVSAILEECSDSECSESAPFHQGGPAHFSCSGGGCDSLAYSYSEYQRLKFSFSDGKTRLSNVFTKRNFYARYEVAVRESDLLVTEQAGEIAPFFSVYWLILCAGVLLAVGFLVSIILLFVVALRGRGYEEGRKLYIAAWIVSLPTAAILLLVSIFTGMIWLLAAETAIAFVYAAWRKRSMALVLTVVLLLAMATLPVFAVILGGVLNPGTTGAAWVIGTVVVLWLLDAGFLAVALRRSARLMEALLFGLVLNVPAFVLGLLSIILRSLSSSR